MKQETIDDIINLTLAYFGAVILGFCYLCKEVGFVWKMEKKYICPYLNKHNSKCTYKGNYRKCGYIKNPKKCELLKLSHLNGNTEEVVTK